MNTTRLRGVLRDVEPAVARVIDVPASATLPEPHDVLQAAIGWTDSHLHQFVTPQATYGMEIPGAEVWPEDQRDETGALLQRIAPSRTIVVIEHDMDFMRRYADFVTVMHTGKVLAEGTVAEIQADQQVQAVYLGTAT